MGNVVTVSHIHIIRYYIPTDSWSSLSPTEAAPRPELSLVCVCVDRVSGLVAPLSSVTYTTLCASTSAEVGRTTNQICLRVRSAGLTFFLSLLRRRGDH